MAMVNKNENIWGANMSEGMLNKAINKKNPATPKLIKALVKSLLSP